MSTTESNVQDPTMAPNEPLKCEKCGKPFATKKVRDNHQASCTYKTVESVIPTSILAKLAPESISIHGTAFQGNTLIKNVAFLQHEASAHGLYIAGMSTLLNRLILIVFDRV